MMSGGLSELWRRRVFRSAALYIAVAWGLTETLGFLLPALRFPEWTVTVVALLFVVGFPVAMFLAWMFDVGPDGIRRTSPTSLRGGFTLVLSTGLLITATAGLFWLIYPEGPEHNNYPTFPAPPSEKSLAVLPFQNFGLDVTDQYIGDGLAEELLTLLANTGDLRVAARTSSFAFQDKLDDIRTIGRQLNVSKVLEGSIRRDGGKIRVTAQLINVNDGYHLWAETYEGEMNDLFEIQDEIAAAVANALEAQMLAAEERPVRHPARDIRAYELYMLGRYQWNRRLPETLSLAIDYFRQAIDLDPSYALAYSGMADTYILLNDYADLPLDEAAPKAIAAAHKAIELDDRLAEAHASLGLTAFFAQDFTIASYALTQAIELNPNYAMAHLWLGKIDQDLGNFDQALESHYEAWQLDPLSQAINNNMGVDLVWMGQFQEAAKYYRRSIELEPDHPNAYWGMGAANKNAGALEEGIRWYKEAHARDPQNLLYLREIALAFLNIGDDAEADEWLQRAVSIDPDSDWVSYTKNFFFIARGEIDDYVAYRKVLAESRPDDPWATAELARAHLYAGDPELARDLYESLLENGSEFVMFNRWNFIFGYSPGANLALAYKLLGDDDAKEQIIAKTHDHMEELRSHGMRLPGMLHVEALLSAIEGNDTEALTRLRDAISVGWRSYRFTEAHPAFETIRENEAFGALLKRMQKPRRSLASAAFDVRDADWTRSSI